MCIQFFFGFEFDLELSTRPELFLGEGSMWDKAEAQLKDVLNSSGYKWRLSPGEGAFYGPKIDIHVKDALGRTHQCATIQLDFQLPIKFDLSYQKENGELGRPVIIHRAICGSLERMFAILIEHTGGKWPFWLSPRQAVVVPVDPKFLEYAEQVRKQIHEAGFYVDVDSSDKTLNKKIRDAQLEQYNYILVVGATEQGKGTVNVRKNDQTKEGEKPVADVIAQFSELTKTKK